MNFIKNNKYEILTPSGWCDFSGIKKNNTDNLYKITSGDDTVTATINHVFYVGGEKIKLSKLNVGNKIDGCDEKITKIEFDRNDITYDIVGVNNDKSSFIVNRCHTTKNCDEFAFVPGNVSSAFWAANYPTISASKDAKIVLISTPRGMYNQFHTIYSQAERSENSFVPFKATWVDVPGRDKEWAEEQKRNIGAVRFSQEYSCDFLGSTNTVISPDVLEYLFTQYIDPIVTDMNGHFRIYEKPVKGYTYLVGNDVSKGTGGDYSVSQVLKLISTQPLKFEQVAVFEDNFTDVYAFTDIINRIGIYYNNAHILVENNAEGAAVVNKLWWDLENDKLVNTGNKAVDLGIRATRSTKPRAVLLMKKLIEDQCLTIKDRTTVEQLASFIEENDKFFGKDLHDDCVSALYWACFSIFFDLFDTSVQLKSGMQVDDDHSEEEIWGVLSDIEQAVDDFSWLESVNYNITDH
jgi:hypothetical protein